MGRKPEGAQALTGAERQARYRARHASTTDTTPPPCQKRRPARPGRRRGRSGGTRRWPPWWPCKPSMPPGWTRCRRPPATARPAKRCRPSSISTWTSSSPFARRAASAAISTGRQRDRCRPCDACPGGSTGREARRAAPPASWGRSAARPASLPVDYLDKPARPRAWPIVATGVAQIWMSPPDQIWMSLDNQRGATRVGVARILAWPASPDGGWGASWFDPVASAACRDRRNRRLLCRQGGQPCDWSRYPLAFVFRASIPMARPKSWPRAGSGPTRST